MQNLLTPLRKILIILNPLLAHLQFRLTSLYWQPATCSIWINTTRAIELVNREVPLVWINSTTSSLVVIYPSVSQQGIFDSFAEQGHFIIALQRSEAFMIGNY